MLDPMLEPIKFYTRINMKDNMWNKAATILHENRGFVSIPTFGSGVLMEADDIITPVLQASWNLMQGIEK